MPTVLDVLRTHLIGDDAAAKLEEGLTELKEAVARRSAMTAGAPTRRNRVTSNSASWDVPPTDQLLANLKAFAAVISGIGLAVGKVIQRVAQLPPSRGYEPLLIESGWHPLVARGMAKLAVRHGKRRAKESKRRRPVFDAIRFLGERKRQRRAILRRTELLLQAWKETSIIESCFDEIGLNETEFIRLLESVVEGREADCPRITEIAAMVSPRLFLLRGPKIGAASAAHEFILASDIEVSSRQRPDTYRRRSSEYVDALTEATRREFDVPDFDPRSARRRLKARHGTNPASR
jgi:hypothetical protein